MERYNDAKVALSKIISPFKPLEHNHNICLKFNTQKGNSKKSRKLNTVLI